MLDTELVKNIKQGKDEDESIKQLLSYHGGLLNRISFKYSKPLSDAGSSFNEVFNERHYIVYKAAMSYNESRKVKFSSYLGSFTRWYCLNKINRTENWRFVSDEFLENHPAEPVDSNTKDHVSYLMEKISDEKIKKVLALRYFSGNNKQPSWAKIATELGVSGQTCNNWARKGLKLINSLVKGSVDAKNG